MKSNTKKVARRRAERQELMSKVMGSVMGSVLEKLGVLGEVAEPVIDELPPDVEAEGIDFLREQFPILLSQLEVMTHADVLEPRILFFDRDEDAEDEKWRRRDVHCGHPMMFPQGIESFVEYLDSILEGKRYRLAIWHMSITMHQDSHDFHHLFFIRHRAGHDMQLVVRDGEIIRLPISSDIGRKMVLVALDVRQSNKAQNTLMRPFVDLREAVACKADALDAALIAQGLAPLGVADNRLPAIAKWLLDPEQLLPAIMPILRGGAREGIAAPVTALLDVAVRAATEAAQVVQEGRKAYEMEMQETFDRKHRRINDELQTTKTLMQGAREAALRTQAELKAVRAELAAATQPAPAKPHTNLADALNSFFD